MEVPVNTDRIGDNNRVGMGEVAGDVFGELVEGDSIGSGGKNLTVSNESVLELKQESEERQTHLLQIPNPLQ